MKDMDFSGVEEIKSGQLRLTTHESSGFIFFRVLEVNEHGDVRFKVIGKNMDFRYDDEEWLASNYALMKNSRHYNKNYMYLLNLFNQAGWDI